jgi:hypothetical protein
MIRKNSFFELTRCLSENSALVFLLAASTIQANFPPNPEIIDHTNPEIIDHTNPEIIDHTMPIPYE